MARQACALFGGTNTVRDRMSQAIREGRIRKGWQPHELAAFADHGDESMVRGLETDGDLPPRRVLLSLLWAVDLSLERVLPLHGLTTDDKAHWWSEMEKRFNVLAASDGNPPSHDDASLDFFLRLEALDEICPVPDPVETGQREALLEELRSRLPVENCAS
jgi:hypothetical protein